MGRDRDLAVKQELRKTNRAMALPIVLSIAALLVLLSLLRPVDAYPSAYVATIDATCFVYLPHVVKESTPTSTPTPTSTSTPTPTSTSTPTSTPHPIPGVDLRVWDIVNSPEVPVIGQTIIFTVSVINQGRDDAPAAAYLRLSVDGEKVGEDYLILPPDLESGDVTKWLWGLSSGDLDAGSHTMEGWIDVTDAVSEIDESNNTLQDGFEVVEPSQ
jgi:hypothetical protein